MESQLHSRPERFPGEFAIFPPEETDWFDYRVQEGDRIISIRTYRKRVENGSPRAVLLAIHGLKAFADSLANVADAVAKHGIETVALDQRPFGRSTSARRGNFRSVDTLVDDIIGYIRHV
jgi:alpha-beta hydrolase superfamily lysophospholipase